MTFSAAVIALLSGEPLPAATRRAIALLLLQLLRRRYDSIRILEYSDRGRRAG
jgi:hypothetical protein